MKPSAAWTDDCQGKKDYDGELLSISTRYWPGSREQADGGHWNAIEGGHFVTRPYRSDGKPHASAKILLMHGDQDMGDYVVWRAQEFVADTPEEVKALVEEWVQARFDEVRQLLGI